MNNCDGKESIEPALQENQGGNNENDALFSDDDSGGESTHPEDEESDAGAETDEHDGDDFGFGGGGAEEQLERRAAATGSSGAGDRSNLAPQAMQWAVRARTKTNSRVAASAGGGGGGFIYIDPSSLRRSATTGAAVATASMSEPVTMGTTASALARAFGIVVRQIADLLAMLQDYNGASAPAAGLPRTLEISYQESINLQLLIEYQMKPNWDWLMTVMDSTEAQLRFGSALSNLATESGLQSSLYPAQRLRGGGERSMPTRSGSGSSGDQLANRREFLNYALSLMRAHNAEHSDSLPVSSKHSTLKLVFRFRIRHYSLSIWGDRNRYRLPLKHLNPAEPKAPYSHVS